jgi:hypothetical protein
MRASLRPTTSLPGSVTDEDFYSNTGRLSLIDNRSHIETLAGDLAYYF